MKSVKEYLKKRKEKAAAKREAAKAQMAETGKKRIKQIRGAYDNADSAFGNIHRARKKRDEALKEIME